MPRADYNQTVAIKQGIIAALRDNLSDEFTAGDNPHCPACSHAAYYGEGRDAGGRTWRWHFSPLFGPTFVRKDGKPLKRSPAYRPHHPAWAVFEPWYRENWLTRETPHA